MPVLAKLGDMYGHKRILLIAAILTAAASWWLAFAGDFWSFLIAWALQGFYVVWLPLEVALIFERGRRQNHGVSLTRYGGGEADGIRWTRDQESRCGDAVVRDVLQYVTRDLFACEVDVRLVVVEGADHVVAVSPGVFPGEVALKALAFGKARDIEPVASPALAVVR